ncbi:MAG: histidine phosphatase family protein [Oscillochloridaceae bacterium umkhey_bin13]
MRTSIWLVRHGQTQFNRERRYQSSSDSPLTAYGQQQIQTLATRLRRIPFGVALVSPSERTRRTAEAILAGRPNVQVELTADWAETNHGRWEGLTYREVLARYPDEARARWAAGINGRARGGESLAEVAARVTMGWQQILQHHVGGQILIVTHATPIQLVLCASAGLPFSEHWRWRVDLGSITALDVYGRNVIVRMVNTVPRLNEQGNASSEDA